MNEELLHKSSSDIEDWLERCQTGVTGLLEQSNQLITQSQEAILLTTQLLNELRKD